MWWLYILFFLDVSWLGFLLPMSRFWLCFHINMLSIPQSYIYAIYIYIPQSYIYMLNKHVLTVLWKSHLLAFYDWSFMYNACMLLVKVFSFFLSFFLFFYLSFFLSFLGELYHRIFNSNLKLVSYTFFLHGQNKNQMYFHEEQEQNDY